jgi:trans-aconitate 2-methyltransferase
VVDLGCEPGNSMQLLIERFAHADLIGVDSSPDRLRQDREQLPRWTVVAADLSTRMPESGTELLFDNAVFHRVQPGSFLSLTCCVHHNIIETREGCLA